MLFRHLRTFPLRSLFFSDGVRVTTRGEDIRSASYRTGSLANRSGKGGVSSCNTVISFPNLRGGLREL